jgi:DNA-binding response OmpR family regulator
LTERVARANFAGSRAHLSGMPLRRVVFVVDDEPTIARTLKVILDQSGFEAMAFEDPLAAIVATVELAPDALIADVVMPKMNGIELAIRFRTIQPQCKILLFSGQAITADLIAEAKLEGYSFELLPKPVHPSEILAKLRAMLL